ncbi:uncharacterized protein LOC115562210 isoform X1 [Drosophila navojoa]|uniref:uncharacterized protein LOC115562210 isoform X1 n=1 Tax=Drosophila navojoa TaxID=7232 RepID=UPI0011BEEC8D|nr:uncharacterized protein LOC115562210 isoform X1 [Drosophila navojoa]
MLRLGLFHISLFAVALLLVYQTLAIDYANPKSQVEYINVHPGDKPNIVQITRPPLLNQTPPPPPGDSKNFAYNPKTQTWTKISPHDPQPDEGTLIWNQSNDKWLTNGPGS